VILHFWKTGSEAGFDGPVYVSVTDFKVTRLRDYLLAMVTGLRLRAGWRRHEGSLGLWLWAKPLQQRAGSVSVWRSEEDLMKFVRWPTHVEIMRNFRPRGHVTSVSWSEPEFQPGPTFKAAAQRLDGGDPELAHS
jgi:hypothetical protein